MSDPTTAQPGEPRSWTLHIPAPAPFLTPNKRGIWQVKARHTKTWRDLTWALARKAHLPTGLPRVRIDAVLHFHGDRDRDDANLVDIVKPCVDALGPPFVRVGKKRAAAPGHGLIVDDTPKHLDGPHVEVGDNDPTGQWGSLDLLITDLSGVPAGRTWTPRLRLCTNRHRITVKRACNGCSRLLGDVTDAEIEAAIDGLPPSDVRHECPTCSAGERP